MWRLYCCNMNGFRQIDSWWDFFPFFKLSYDWKIEFWCCTWLSDRKHVNWTSVIKMSNIRWVQLEGLNLLNGHSNILSLFIFLWIACRFIHYHFMHKFKLFRNKTWFLAILHIEPFICELVINFITTVRSK